MAQKLRVGIVFGGRSGEHEVSIASAVSVYNALDKSKYEVVLLGIDQTGRWLMPSESLMLAHKNSPMEMKLAEVSGAVSLVPYRNPSGGSSSQLISTEPNKPMQSVKSMDVILPILHGTYGEDGTIQGLLEMADIPFVGSGVLGSAIGMDKDVARRLLKAAGIPVVPTHVIKKSEWLNRKAQVEKQVQSQFTWPVFVKPANAGSSVGVSKVKSADQLAKAVDEAFQYDLKVLIEKGVSARELECAVLGNHEPKASVIGEIIPTHEFYSYEAKYLDENGMTFNIPAKDLSPELSEQIRQCALKAFSVLELRGMARVDFFLDKTTKELYLNEVNTIPGFTKISMYPKMWEASGLPYAKLLDELIRLALEHHQDKSTLKTTVD